MNKEIKHTLVQTGNSWRYGPWIIEYANWTRPSAAFDVDYRHEDYDGPEDNRCGAAASVEACVTEIEELEDFTLKANPQ